MPRSGLKHCGVQLCEGDKSDYVSEQEQGDAREEEQVFSE